MRLGVGLRSAHYPHLEAHKPKVAEWFEAISENYMDSLGRPREMLRRLRKDFPIALHGVSMSLASATGLDTNYLHKLKALIDDIDPFIVSDHLCWTGFAHHNMHDLLPFPYTEETLTQVVNNLDRAQNVLGRQILIENISAYIAFDDNEYPEEAFIVEAAKRAGAQILLDINNVYVNAQNFAFSASRYIQSIPEHLIGQIHLAGFSDLGDFLFDTHSTPVCTEVWQLFSELAPRIRGIPVAIEWDEHIPSFPDLEQELQKAEAMVEYDGQPL